MLFHKKETFFTGSEQVKSSKLGVHGSRRLFLLTIHVRRMWRNEVAMRKRERTRQQAVEIRQMQKLFLLKAMASPGTP